MPSAVIESPRLLSLTRRTVSLEDALTKLSTHDGNTDDLTAGDNWELGEGLGLLLLATPSRSSQHTRLIWFKDTIIEVAGSILPSFDVPRNMFRVRKYTSGSTYCCLELLDVNKHKIYMFCAYGEARGLSCACWCVCAVTYLEPQP